MQLQLFPYHLSFKYPFKIAHTNRTGTENLYILLSDGQYHGWGEAVFPPYVPENRTLAERLINSVNINNRIEALKTLEEFPFTRAGLEMAYHNLVAHTKGNELHQSFQLPPPNLVSSYTIGISSKSEMAIKIKEAPQNAYFKLKVNQELAFQIVEDFKSLSNAQFVIDANQGFEDKNTALEFAQFLEENKVNYLEQPFHKNNYEDHEWLKEQVSIPIIADESFQNIKDLEKVAKSFDGINVKIMKCGGIQNAFDILTKAKQLNLKRIIGCMSGSSIAVNTARQLSSLANWIDLDGPVLINNDPFFDYSPEQLKEKMNYLKKESHPKKG